MQERGYQLVGKDEQPDTSITISTIFNNQTGIISYPSTGLLQQFLGSLHGDMVAMITISLTFPTLYTRYGRGAVNDIVDLKDAEKTKIEGCGTGL